MWSRQDCAKILVAAVLFLCVGLLLFPPVSQPATFTPTIYVANTSTNVTDASIADALPAFQAAIDTDFAPAWNQAATLVQLAPGETVPAGAWTIALSDTPDVWGAAGYHSIRGNDVPYAKVFTQTRLNWQLIFTHELFEMLADPHVDRASFNWPTGDFYVLEVCDPVERQRYAYTLPSATGPSVVISDFVTERWYDGQGGGLLDYGGHVKHAHHVLDGGYMTVYTGGGWVAELVDGRRAEVFHLKRGAK